MKNIAIVTHKYLPQPDDDLAAYLNKKKAYKIFHIKHSFPDAKDRRSVLDYYSKGKKTRQIKTIDYIFLPEAAIYLKEVFFTFRWLTGFSEKYDLYIGMDGLSAFWGIILKKLGVCKKVAYWSIDFVPVNRFKSSLKNYFYRWVNSYSCKNADEVWDLSPRMMEGRRKFLGIQEKDYKHHKVVAYGVWTDRIRKVPFNKCEKSTLVFMGHLLPKQGVDIVLKQVPNIVKKIPKFKFKIIGEGSFKQDLTNLVKNLGIEKYCEFLGRIDSATEMEAEIAKSSVAIAPYKKTSDNYSYYADPGKVKTYLACGVPVLMTDLPWNAKEIEKNKCGMIIKDDGSDLIVKLIKIMKPQVNNKFRKNAAHYSKNYDYEEIFSSLKL